MRQSDGRSTDAAAHGASEPGPSRRAVLTRGAAVAGAATLGPGVLGALATAPATAAARHSHRDHESHPGHQDPDTSSSAPGYLGYRRADYAKPWAKYFTERTSPVQRHVPPTLRVPVPAADIPSLDELREEIGTPGYSPIETGWGTTADGSSWTAVLTQMPGVRPEMWDWWFGWHSSEPSRYKLWHPEAHVYAALREDRTHDHGLSDKQRYLGNTSYVDEYLPDYRSGFEYLGALAGGILINLGISFVEPAGEGFDLSAFDGTAIVGRGGPQGQGVTGSLFVHQVRATKHGSEMRSRFYNPAEPSGTVRPDDPAALAALAARGPLPGLLPPQLGSFLLLHCAQEMNHLARFLPRLHREFGRR